MTKNNTLEVYRLRPDARYLGMVRIVEATANQSVGRLVPVGNAARADLKVGDLVASHLTPTQDTIEPKKN